MDVPPITVYTTPNCSACAAVKRFLREKGLPFTERDVTRDPAALKAMIEVANVRIAPVTVVGERFFYGTFSDQRPGLEAALGLKQAALEEGGEP